MKKLHLALISISLFLVCCTGTQYLIPTSADVTAAQSHWKGVTMADIQQGYNIYMDKCTDCHGTKKPQKYSEAKWYDIMKTMGHKAKLDSTRYYQVLHYILAKRETVMAGKK